MKKRCIAVILLWVMITCFGLYIRSIAFADALSPGAIAGTAYMMGQQLGFGFDMTGLSAGQAEAWMTGNINEYAAQQQMTVDELFGDQVIIDAAGKLAIGQTTYNAMADFLGWLKDKYNLSDAVQSLNEMIGEYSLGPGRFQSGDFSYAGWTATNGVSGSYWQISWIDANGTISGTRSSVIQSQYPIFEGIRIYRSNEYQLAADAFYSNSLGGSKHQAAYHNFDRPIEYGTVSGSYVDSGLPTVLNPGKEWYGSLGGYDVPDTNLEQLMGQVFQDVADNNLDVDGEIIDVPVPPGPVPTWTPVDDVIDGINQVGEQLDGIGNDIGDISGHLDDIGDQVDSIEQSLEGVQEGIETQTGIISGAIDQATSDVVDAIGEQTATLDQTLTDTAESVQDIAEALQPGEIEPKKFDLRGLFPFCIPFDIHNLLQKFQAEPVAPHVQLPFVIQSIGFSYTFDLDFSAFDSVAAVMRTVEFIVFAIGLAWATSKVIKW